MILKYNVSHLDGIIQLAEQILSCIENKAFFNWNESHLKSESLHSLGLVQVEQKQVLGFILYRDSVDSFEIMVLAVSPAHQRAGYMTSLMRDLQQCAAQQSKSILLEVHIDNKPACDLYSKLGFKKQSLRKNYYNDGGSCILFKWGPFSD
jgi:ribosomal-protein-alanine N-acetyltransferase